MPLNVFKRLTLEPLLLQLQHQYMYSKENEEAAMRILHGGMKKLMSSLQKGIRNLQNELNNKFWHSRGLFMEKHFCRESQGDGPEARVECEVAFEKEEWQRFGGHLLVCLEGQLAILNHVLRATPQLAGLSEKKED